MVVRARKGVGLVAAAALAGSLLAVSPESTAAVAAQPLPQPLAPYRIGYVSEDSPQPPPSEPGRDIWSADARGENREDVTNLPGGYETDPAYSPDGTRIAYVRRDIEGPSYLEVADADGSNARPLTVPSFDYGYDQPVWSPDGTMIAAAYSTVESSRSVRIIRVADGLVLGDVPMPAHLAGEDGEPAWSPDGTRIALRREIYQQDTPKVDPFLPSAIIAQGSSLALAATMRTPLAPTEPQIMFLLDTSGSMGDALTTAKNRLHEVLNEVADEQPNAEFGLATYTDITYPDHFVLHENLTTDRQAVLDKLAGLQLGDGGDAGEDWFNALNQLTVEPVFTRPETSRIVVLIGDAWSHEECDEPVEPNGPCSPGLGYLQREDVVAELDELDIRVVAVPVLPPEPGFFSPGLNKYGQAADIASQTKGSILPTDSPADQLTEAIRRAISDLAVTVTPVASCDPSLIMTFDPPSITTEGDTEVRFAENVLVSGDAPAGATLDCTVEFELSGPPQPDPFMQHISLTVAEPGLPRVVVEGRAVPSADSTGAVVDYASSAADAEGRPLETACTPSSGSLFPIGTTTVTCTATDADGNVGTASAVMTIVSALDDQIAVWVVGVTPPAPDELAITNQIDLSAALSEPCASGWNTAPDWSPDGRSLVFVHNGDTICVAEADGSGARQLVQDAFSFMQDPAWSPDGALIAFTEGGGEGESDSIWTVPAAGGTSEVLIDTAGGASYPAFQRLADLGVLGSATPPSVPVDGATTLEFVLANSGLARAPNTAAVVQLPAGLRPDEISTTTGTCVLDTLRCALGPLAPGETATIRLVVTGVATGQQPARIAVTGDSREANPPDNEASVTVAVARPAPPPAGSLSTAITVTPEAGYVGGDDVVVTFTVRNGTTRAVSAVVLATALPATLQPLSSVAPAGCRPDGSVCELGTLQPEQSVVVRFGIPARAAVDTAVSGTVTAIGADRDKADNTATGRLVVRQPAVTVDPQIGVPGFVARATGTDFPPGARVRLTWSVGLSETPGEATVGADGRLDAQVLIFHRDPLGPRELAVAPVSGPRFGAVTSQPFLVVPRALQPPSFKERH